MSDQTPESASGALPLPETPNLEWLRKRAKHGTKEQVKRTMAYSRRLSHWTLGEMRANAAESSRRT